MKRQRDILYLRCMDSSALLGRIVKQVCADLAGKEKGNTLFTIAMASNQVTFDGGVSYLEPAAPPAKLEAFQKELNCQTTRDRAGNPYTFHPSADTMYPNFTSSSVLGRCCGKAVTILGSSSVGKVLRKIGRKRERFASVEVDATMRKEANAYATQHEVTNLANKRKAEVLQRENRRKEALAHSQAAQVSDVTGVSGSVPELAGNEKGADSELAQASGESGRANGDPQMQPEKSAIGMDVSVADKEVMPKEQKPLEASMDLANDFNQGKFSPSNDVSFLHQAVSAGWWRSTTRIWPAFSQTDESDSHSAM